MRPANFPGRKNERREKALARLVKAGTSGKLSEQRYDDAYLALSRLLNPAATAIRTKKSRGVGRAARAA